MVYLSPSIEYSAHPRYSRAEGGERAKAASEDSQEVSGIR